MRPHVQRTVAGCFDVLRQLRSIRSSIIYAPNAGRHPCAVQAAGTTVNATLAGFRSTYLIVYNLSSTLARGAQLVAGLRRSDRRPLP